VTADAANLKPIFDGRLNLDRNPTLTALERKAFNDVVYWQAQRAWQDKENCDDELEILDSASGAYLRPRAKQKAVLYRFCRYARQLGYSGLAIFEAGKVIRHDVWEGGSEYALGTMPDLNKDGINEVLISSGGLNMGESWTFALVAQLGQGSARLITSFDAYHDNCGTLESVKIAKSWKIYAESGKTPRFFQQEFRGVCGSSKPWAQSGRLKPVTTQVIDALGWKRLQ